MKALKQGLMYVLPDIGTDGIVFVITFVLSRSVSGHTLEIISVVGGVILFYGGAATMCFVNGARSWF